MLCSDASDWAINTAVRISWQRFTSAAVSGVTEIVLLVQGALDFLEFVEAISKHISPWKTARRRSARSQGRCHRWRCCATRRNAR
ncbi:MAG: hypothetical protein DVS81_05385 [Candidatus Accumulibacter meliphilus]|uniref:Uncharacterized protein n=1 Tax=Candidatus Accumulibacter meliphilus TaxID=2211374 RepID=A0A369XQD7_9PROT|nr:MAG: hypothetical protein DVS81_05385 [Candidatus Accumulibacter meliphilus]